MNILKEFKSSKGIIILFKFSNVARNVTIIWNKNL